MTSPFTRKTLAFLRALKRNNNREWFRARKVEYARHVRQPMVELLDSLVSEGKIRYYGWSTDSVEGARVFAEGKHCVTIQHALNVVMDAPEMLRRCEELNLASVNRSPLARGALSGKYARGNVSPQNDAGHEEWSRAHFFTPTRERLEKMRESGTVGLAASEVDHLMAQSRREAEDIRKFGGRGF